MFKLSANVVVLALTLLASTPTMAKISIHGHRGSRGTHPENTIPAFAEAVAAKADFLELDIQLSKDNIPVIHHDPLITPDFCKGPNGESLKESVALNSLTAEEITKYDCGSVPQARFPEQIQIIGTRIPTLAQFLEWWQKNGNGIRLNVESKMDAKPLPDATAYTKTILDTLKKYKALDKTFFQSFDFSTLEAAKKLEPKLVLSCLFDEGEKDIVARTQKMGCKWMSPYFKLLTPAIVKDAHTKGIGVVPWTVNTETDWQSMVDLGVDAIISDYPRKLASYLASHPGKLN